MKTPIRLFTTALFVCFIWAIGNAQCSTIKINGQPVSPGTVTLQNGTTGFVTGNGSGLAYRLFIGTSEVGNGALVGADGSDFPVPNNPGTYQISLNFGINSCPSLGTLNVIDCVPAVVCPGDLTVDANFTQTEIDAWLNTASSMADPICQGDEVSISNNLDLSNIDRCIENVITVDFTLNVTSGPNQGIVDLCRSTLIIPALDTEDPVASCKNISITLDDTGNYVLMPSEVDDNSTDNCEIVEMEVVPNMFDCTDIGDQTVTLKVTDAFGLESTETCTVSINPNAACVAQEDFDLTACTCTNPQNIIVAADLEAALFYETIELEVPYSGLDIFLTNHNDLMLDVNGSPLDQTGSLKMTEQATGQYILEFYHSPDMAPEFTLTLGTVNYNFTSMGCALDRECLLELGIPSIGQWGLFILGMIMMSMGLIYINELQPEKRV